LKRAVEKHKANGKGGVVDDEIHYLRALYKD
jgi:hypothetical protein